MTWETVQQMVRIAGGWLGAFLVTKGFIDGSNVELFIGGFMNFAQLVWWAVWNVKRK